MTRISTITAALLLSASLAGPAAAQQNVLDMFGNLEAGDRRDSQNRLYDEYWIDLQAGQSIRARTVRQGNFDPIIEVYHPNGTMISRNDDGGGGLDAMVTFSADRSGRYLIRVFGWSDTRGGYRILGDWMNPTPQQPAAYWLRGENADSFNDSVGRLSNGSHYRDYRVRMAAGEELVFHMDSSTFDAYLYVFDANNMSNALATNDDSNGSLNSTILFRAPRNGDYIVRASQLSHADGSYRLWVRRLAPF